MANIGRHITQYKDAQYFYCRVTNDGAGFM